MSFLNAVDAEADAQSKESVDSSLPSQQKTQKKSQDLSYHQCLELAKEEDQSRSNTRPASTELALYIPKDNVVVVNDSSEEEEDSTQPSSTCPYDRRLLVAAAEYAVKNKIFAPCSGRIRRGFKPKLYTHLRRCYERAFESTFPKDGKKRDEENRIDSIVRFIKGESGLGWGKPSQWRQFLEKVD
jgi:hypothetical protein